MIYTLIAMAAVMILTNAPWYIIGFLSFSIEIYTAFNMYTAWSYVVRLQSGDISISTYGHVENEKN